MVFKLKEHEADIGVVGIGKTLNEAFSEGARAMFSIMCDLGHVEHVECAQVQCSASSVEMLFVEFLNKLLAKAGIREMLFNEFKVKITGGAPGRRHPERRTNKSRPLSPQAPRPLNKYHLTCTACGETLDQVKHGTKIEVKAATPYGLKHEKRTIKVKGKKQVKHYIQCVVDV